MPAMTTDEMREIFAPFDIRNNPDKQLKYPPYLLPKASVLIPLFYKDGEYRILLTLRSKNLSQHAGYVAFPGGMKDDSDEDEIHTALREAEEEIGLDPKSVEIIGLFSPGIVKPYSLVYPVIGIIPADFVPKRNENEVELVFDLPLQRFLSKERLTVEEFRSPIHATYNVHHFKDCVGGQEVDTWGFTAVYCVVTAIGVYQSNQKFCFYENCILDKKNLFSSESTDHVIQQMLKLAAKM